MGSVERHSRDTGVSWQARWRDAEGRQRKRTFNRKCDAERYLAGIQSRLMDSTYIDPSHGRVTVAEWAPSWSAAQGHLKESTRVRYDGLLRTHVLPRWGKVALAKVQHADIAIWVADLQRSGLSASTVRQAFRVFSLMLSLSVRDGRLPKNPADNVRLPRANRAEKRFLSHADVEALAQAAGNHGLTIRLLAYCGVRFGEMAALRVGRVDLPHRRILIAESVTEVNGKAVFGTPKTHATRSIAFPAFLTAALADRVKGRDPNDFVFPAPRGGILLLRNWRRQVFDPAVRSAGLKNVSPHDLRHTAASLAVQAGAHVKAVQRMLGHASAAMTLDVYSGLFEDDLDALAERLNDAAAPAACPQTLAAAVDSSDLAS